MEVTVDLTADAMRPLTTLLTVEKDAGDTDAVDDDFDGLETLEKPDNEFSIRGIGF